MILSFSEFNSLYESYNGYDTEEMYSNGIDVMESLLTVINKKGSLTETEVVTFLDNVLYETGWELNDDVYESYAEWLGDWTPFIDESINEYDGEMSLSLTRRGESLLEEEFVGPQQKTINKVKSKASWGAGKIGQGLKTAGSHIAQTGKGAISGSKAMLGKGKIGDKWKGLDKHQKIGTGVAAGAGAAALGYGAYRGIKALRQRSAAKKAAQQQQ